MTSIGQTDSVRHELTARPKARSGVWGTAREAFWIALEALRAHKLRSFLTLLGVVIAITTLIVVMSIINGMNLYIANRIANLGANVFILDQYKWTTSDEEWLKMQRRNKPIHLEDYEFLKENLGGYKNIGADAGVSPRPTIRYETHTLYEVSVRGVTPSMIDIGQEQVESGRFLGDSEYGHSAMACFIGQESSSLPWTPSGRSCPSMACISTWWVRRGASVRPSAKVRITLPSSHSPRSVNTFPSDPTWTSLSRRLTTCI